MRLFDKPISKLTENLITPAEYFKVSQISSPALPLREIVKARLQKIVYKQSQSSQATWLELNYCMLQEDNPNLLKELNTYLALKQKLFLTKADGSEMETFGIKNKEYIQGVLTACEKAIDSMWSVDKYNNQVLDFSNMKLNQLPLLDVMLGVEKNHPVTKLPDSEEFKVWEDFYFLYNTVVHAKLNRDTKYSLDEELTERYTSIGEQLAMRINPKQTNGYKFDETKGIIQWKQIPNAVEENFKVAHSNVKNPFGSTTPNNTFGTQPNPFGTQQTQTGFGNNQNTGFGNKTVQSNFGTNNNENKPF